MDLHLTLLCNLETLPTAAHLPCLQKTTSGWARCVWCLAGYLRILRTGSQPAFHLGCGGSCMLARQPHRRSTDMPAGACQLSVVS